VRFAIVGKKCGVVSTGDAATVDVVAVVRWIRTTTAVAMVTIQITTTPRSELFGRRLVCIEDFLVFMAL